MTTNLVPPPMLIVARVDWPEAQGGSAADVGFDGGQFYLNGVPIAEPGALDSWERDGYLTWTDDEQRRWYRAHLDANGELVCQSQSERPFPRDIGVLLGAAYLVGFLAASWALVAPITLDGGRRIAAFSVLLDVRAWAAVALGFVVDVMISRSDRLPDTGKRAIRLGGLRFFHGPLIAAGILVSLLVGLLLASR